jgi:hypothetical protein
LPDDGRCHRAPRGAFPDHGGLALVGNPHRDDLRGSRAGTIQQQARGIELRIPDLIGVLLHPARLWITAFDRRSIHGDAATLFVIERRARTGGAFIDGEHKRHWLIMAQFQPPRLELRRSEGGQSWPQPPFRRLAG